MWHFTEEEKQLQGLCQEFAQKELAPLAQDLDEKEGFNLKAFKKMGEMGLLGITADVEYGGSGMKAVAATLSMEELSYACASTTLSYLAHALLCVNNIQVNGSKEQKEKYLPDLISGKKIGCMAMSEPGFGSDALGMQTKAQKVQDQYHITGTKTWITNGPEADICYLYARTGPERKNISSFIVETKWKGFSKSKKISKLGMRASPTGELILEQLPVPLTNLVGEENKALNSMMKNLDLERIAIAGISLGLARACVDQCTRYAKERQQFGKPLAHFQMIQKMIADMSAHTQMLRHFVYSAAREFELGTIDKVLAAQVKLAVPRLVTQIALDAIQIHGGYGYSREFPVERYLRDAKLMEIGAGTNEVMVMIIAKNLLELKDTIA